MIEGVYTRTKDFYNNFPVYQRENVHNLGLYYYPDKNGDKLLTFGNDRGDGFFHHYGLAARLNRDPTSWLLSSLDKNNVFGGLVEEWIYYNLRNKTNYVVPVDASSPVIKAVCVDKDFRECNSDRVYLNQRLHDTSGTIWNDPTTDYFYRMEGSFRDLRPIYKHSAIPSFYLLYVDGYWVVTSSYRRANSENAMLRVKDFALRPEYITKTWWQWSHGWRDMRSLRVLCRGVTSMANICPSKPCGSNSTCVYTSGNETLCLCRSGYTGVKCSVNKQCPARYQKPDTELNFENLGNRPGDLGMTFCSESYPSLRYYLCVDGIYTSHWRGQGSSICTRKEPSITVTAPSQLVFLFLQTTGTPQAMPNFKDYLFVFPLAIVLQVFLPVAFIIFAVCKRRSQEIRDYRARVEHHRQVGHELGRLPRVTATGGQGGPNQGDQQSQQAGQEYLGLHRSKDVNVSRIISMDMYFSFYLWLVFLIGCDASHCTMYGEVFNMLRIMAIVMLCVSPAFVLLESFFCHELDYLKNIIEDESASEYIERMREVPPKIDIVVECFHFETDTRIVHYRDASGNRHSRTEPLYLDRKIVTFVDHEEFSFGSWIDVSRREISALTDATLTRFEIDSSIQFGDQETANAYNWQVAEMVRRNLHRDVLIDHVQHSTKEIPGLKKRVSAFKDLTVKPFWMRPLFFWIATLLGMTWPYRWLFRAKTAKKLFVLKKMVYKSTTPSRDVDLHAAGETSSVVNSRGTDNTCTDYTMSVIKNIFGPANSLHNQNAAALSGLSLPFPAELHPNVPLSSIFAMMNNPSPGSSAPYSPFSTYAGPVFPPYTAAYVPRVPPPSYEASQGSLDPEPSKEQ